MKAQILLLVLISLTACSSGGAGNSATASSTTVSASSSSLSSEEQTIETLYPPLPYIDATSLKSLADFPIGLEVQVADDIRSIFTVTEQQDLIERHFSELVAGQHMKAPFLHPEEDIFYFEDADALVDYALANNIAMHGHTLIWYFHEGQTVMPDWMLNYDGDWDAMIENHITEIVSHFEGRVRSWDVVNEAVQTVRDTNGNIVAAEYRDTPFYQNLGEDYIENAFIYAHAADPNATLYYNDWALSHNDSKLDFTLQMISDLLAKGVPVHGIGFQMHAWIDHPSKEDIQEAFTKAAATGLQIKITELDVRTAQPYYSGGAVTTQFSAALKLQQKDRYKEIVQAYLEAVTPSQRGGITVWGLIDGESWVNNAHTDWPLLFYNDLTVKPSFYGLVEALTEQ